LAKQVKKAAGNNDYVDYGISIKAFSPKLAMKATLHITCGTDWYATNMMIKLELDSIEKLTTMVSIFR
jgi:hypothetical protein